MINKKTYDRIEKLAEDSIEDVFYALVEEVGELGLALHVERGQKIRELKEPSTVEAIDIMLVAIEMYIKLGGSYDELEKISKIKLDKWEGSSKKRFHNESCTHTYPNGESAIPPSTMFFKSCEICGWNDL